MYFVLLDFKIRDRKMRFSGSSQNSLSEKSIFALSAVIFLNVYIFSKAGWLFPVSTFKEKLFNEKMRSLAGRKKSYSLFRKSTDFGPFWLPGSTFKADFLNVEAKFRKIIGQLRGGRLFETSC